MAEVEMNPEDNIYENFSTSDEEDDLAVSGENQDRVNDVLIPAPTAPIVEVGPKKEVGESTEILPTLALSSNGVEEVNFPGNDQYTDDEAIVNDFPAKPEVSGLSTMTSSVPTPNVGTPGGFEEVSAGVDEKPLVDGLAATAPLVPISSSGTPEGFDELSTGADEKPLNGIAPVTPSVLALSTGTPGGFEELNTEADKNPLNGPATTTPSVPTPSGGAPEGFEELNAGVDEKSLVNGLSTLTPSVPTSSSGTPGEFEEVNTGADEKPLVIGLATTAPSVPTPSSGTPGGFEEVNTGIDEEPVVSGLAITTPPVPTSNNGTHEGFEELNTGVDEKHLNVKKDGILKSPLALWLKEQNLHPQVVRLLYWVEVQKTTGVFGSILLLLVSLRFYSLIEVVMTFALSLLVVAFFYRVGMTIVKAVWKTSAEHPFKQLLEEKMEISEEAMQYWSSKARQCINEKIRQAQCLFLVKDTVASLRAMIMFLFISYIASGVDFVSICIVSTVLLFTVPELYEEKQKEIDQLYSVVKHASCFAYQMIENKVPEKVKGYLKKVKSE